MNALALVALAGLSCASPVAAQSLAEAARRGDDARRSRTTRVLTDKDLTPESVSAEQQISGHALTQRNFQAFMNTRRAYVKMLLMDAPLRGRMQARMTEAKSIETAVAAWNGEEAVLSLIRENGTNPHEFLLTELALAQAVIIMKAIEQTGPPPEGLSPTVAQNVAFARSHWPEIESFAREIQALASQMR
jgi:hypothetical protein